ncbi:rhodanese-like domain-containing protein [Sphingomonas oligophenolica]|uniref:Rhodanese-like domain-containing protein n=1 Tax=Sphingomonas oligophenolica TaxID=301154 RepID=A0ABU9YBV4_9SPHN
MFGFGKQAIAREIGVNDLKRLLDNGAAMVVDVREPDEFAAGHIPGAANLPLSRFDPALLPETNGKLLVLNCAAGRRSAMALEQCAKAGAPVDTHITGGFSAWQRARLPIAFGH